MEKCVHRSTNIGSGIQEQTHTPMTQSQVKTQQIYQMIKNTPVDAGNEGSALYFSGNPQITQFKRVYRRTTPHLKFPVKLPVVNGLLTLEYTQYDAINSISNLILVFKVDKYVQFDQAFDQITKIMFRIGDTTLFDVNGRMALSILKLYPDVYQKSSDDYKSGTITIPLQFLIFDKLPFTLCGLKENLTINCISTYPVESWCYGYKLGAEEYKRCSGLLTGSEETLWQYIAIEQDNCGEIMLDYPVCMGEIIVDPKSTADVYDVQVTGIPLLRGDHPLLGYGNHVVTDDHCYYYLGQIIPDLADSGLYSGFIQGCPSTKLTIVPPCQHVTILIRYRSVLRCHEGQSALIDCLDRIKPGYPNYQTLRKIDETHFVEGFWRVKGIPAPKYPFPYPLINTPVDQEYLNKLPISIKNLPSEDCFGFAACNLCQAHLPCGHVELTHNGVTFKVEKNSSIMRQNIMYNQVRSFASLSCHFLSVHLNLWLKGFGNGGNLMPMSIQSIPKISCLSSSCPTPMRIFQVL